MTGIDLSSCAASLSLAVRAETALLIASDAMLSGAGAAAKGGCDRHAGQYKRIMLHLQQQQEARNRSCRHLMGCPV